MNLTNINNYITYNSKVILTLFFSSLIILIINKLTNNKANKLLFSTYRSSIFNPLTYIRLFTHILGHSDYSHFRNNYLTILIVGPLIEEKYGSYNLFIIIVITSLITGILHNLISKKALLGSSGIAFMLIILSGFVNVSSGKLPITLILIIIFYIISEILDGLFKKDNVSHFGHLIGAIAGFVYGFYML